MAEHLSTGEQSARSTNARTRWTDDTMSGPGCTYEAVLAPATEQPAGLLDDL